MTTAIDTKQRPEPTEAEARAAREASRLSYRSGVPADWQDEYDRLTKRQQPRAAAALIRERIRRRKTEAAIPVAEAVVAGLRGY